MSKNAIDAGIARRQFDMIEDWKIDHDSAMNCYELEDMIETGSFLYGRLEWLNETTRRLAYRGVGPDASVLASLCLKAHKAWLDAAVHFVPYLAGYESEFGSVKGAGEFRAQITRLEKSLQNWTVLTPSATPGVLPWDVTPEEAAQLHDLVNAPAGSPGTLSRELRPMPSGDSSLIR